LAWKWRLHAPVGLEQAVKTLKFNNFAIFILWPRVNKWFLRINQFFLAKKFFLAIDSCQEKEED
jgi:hypothetical protein